MQGSRLADFSYTDSDSLFLQATDEYDDSEYRPRESLSTTHVNSVNIMNGNSSETRDSSDIPSSGPRETEMEHEQFSTQNELFFFFFFFLFNGS